MYYNMTSLPFILALMSCAFSYEILYAFNCGSEKTIHAPLVTYTSDQMYEGLKSKSVKKRNVPDFYVDQFDIELLSTQRTTLGDQFSYFLTLKGTGNYFLLLKFIEVEYYNEGQRVFEVRLGDDVVLTVDLIDQIAQGVVVNKWIEFELRDDVLYINKTIPVLNGYIYPKQIMKLTLAKIIGQPKLQALILLKGSDSGRFFQEYDYHERNRILGHRQILTCQKYQKGYESIYRNMRDNEYYMRFKNKFEFYLEHLMSFSTFSAIIAVVFVLIYQKVFKSLNGIKENTKVE